MVDAEKPTEWWSPADEAILRGELAKLPRPAYIERDHDRMIYRPVGRVRPRRRWIVEVIGVWIAVAGIAAGLVLLMGVAGPGEPAPNRSTVTPTTYGPPSR
jgi:hypothetical protein